MHDTQSLRPNRENPFEQHLRKHLGDYYEVLYAFFKDIFVNKCDGNTTVVFVARRCFILSLLFLEALRSEIGEAQYKKAYDALCSDGGILEKVVQFARQCAEGKEPEQQFFLADDVLIHGRSMSGLLMSMESLFVTEYKRRYREYNGSECRKLDDMIGNMLLDRTTITVVAQNNRLGLLRQRYLNLVKERKDQPPQKGDEQLALSTPAGWRRMSYQISRAILLSPVPNACFIQSVATGKLTQPDKQERVDRAVVRSRFLNAQNEGRLAGFQLLRTTYGGREMDSYVCEVSEWETVKIVLTLRCADCDKRFPETYSGYLIPFVFLPRLTKEKFDSMEQDVYQALCESHILESEDIVKLDAEWKKIPTLRNELVSLVLSQLLLARFLKEIGLNAPKEAYEINKRQILCNYAHNATVEKILTGLASPEKAQTALNSLCGGTSSTRVEDLAAFLRQKTEHCLLSRDLAPLRESVESSGEDGVICLDFIKGMTADEDTAPYKSMMAMEDIIFDCGLGSERRAYYYARSSISPDEGVIQALRVPTNRGVDVLLREFYSKPNMRIIAPLPLTIACILHLMDAGSLAVVIGKDPKTGDHLHCIRPGEQALLIMPRRYYRYMRTLQGFESYCIKLYRHLQEAFPETLRQFVREYRRCNTLSPWDRDMYCTPFVMDCNTLWDFVNQIYGAGQYCFDYSNNLLDKIIQEEQGQETYLRYRNWSLECKKACKQVMPGIGDDY